MSKKILSIALALVLVLFSAVAFADTFEGIGEGFKPLQVKVDVADGKIAASEMIVNDETPEIGGVAIEKLTKQIIEGQTLAVDTISQQFQVILNTVPAMILPNLSARDDAVILELASSPGMAGQNIISARGLPGIMAPEESGKLIADTFMRLFVD